MSIELRPIHSGRVRGDRGEGRARDRGGSDPSRRVGRGGEGGGAMRPDVLTLSDTATIVYYHQTRSKIHSSSTSRIVIKTHVNIFLPNG